MIEAFPPGRRALLGAAALLGLGGAAPVPPRDFTWRDAARGRDLPVLVRLPEAAGRRPALLVSHGLGGSRHGLAYLGEAAAEAGFLVVHLQHPGSDISIWRGAEERRTPLAAAALDVSQALARLQDGVFALDELTRADGPLAGRVDPARIAMAGHSYGAWTVQHLLGQRIPGGDRGLRLPDPRLAAGIAMSPLPPRGLPPRLAFARVATPMLHLTGTADQSFVDGTSPADREIPFRAISGPPQALGVFAGANHAAFADEREAGPRWSDPAYHARAAGLSVAFLRAVLEQDAAAAAYLRDGAPGLLAPEDRLELKDFGA